MAAPGDDANHRSARGRQCQAEESLGRAGGSWVSSGCDSKGGGIHLCMGAGSWRRRTLATCLACQSGPVKREAAGTMSAVGAEFALRDGERLGRAGSNGARPGDVAVDGGRYVLSWGQWRSRGRARRRRGNATGGAAVLGGGRGPRAARPWGYAGQVDEGTRNACQRNVRTGIATLARPLFRNRGPDDCRQ